MRDEEARTIISRDSYVGDATALLKIDPLVSSSECASLKRETLLVGVGSSVLWFDPFFAVVDDDVVGDGAGGNEKKRDASSTNASSSSSSIKMASKEECLLASCAVALPDGA